MKKARAIVTVMAAVRAAALATTAVRGDGSGDCRGKSNGGDNCCSEGKQWRWQQ